MSMQGDAMNNSDQTALDENKHTAEAESLAEDLPGSQRLEDDQSDEEITQRLLRQGVRLGRGTVAPWVFWPSLITIILAAAVTILAPRTADASLQAAQSWILEHWCRFYMILAPTVN